MNKNLYHILNLEKGEYGEPFSLCDECFPGWSDAVSDKIVYYKIAENSDIPCNLCGR